MCTALGSSWCASSDLLRHGCPKSLGNLPCFPEWAIPHPFPRTWNPSDKLFISVIQMDKDLQHWEMQAFLMLVLSHCSHRAADCLSTHTEATDAKLWTGCTVHVLLPSTKRPEQWVFLVALRRILHVSTPRLRWSCEAVSSLLTCQVRLAFLFSYPPFPPHSGFTESESNLCSTLTLGIKAKIIESILLGWGSEPLNLNFLPILKLDGWQAWQ